MNGFQTVQNEMMAYDPEKDGVWLHDGSDPVMFIPRNTIIGMIGHLPAYPPHSKDRCAECDCANGGDECNWINSKEQEQ